MTAREAFIQRIDEMLEVAPDLFGQDGVAELAMKYYESLKNTSVKEPKVITENGTKILKYAQSNKDIYNNIFTSKSIGEGIGIGSKMVSGSMRKLVTDGFFEKIGANPTTYSITEKGINFTMFDN